MSEFSTHELLKRGTPDFRIELYDVDSKHPRYNMQHHWHNKYEIIHVLKGSLKLHINDDIINLTTNESVFIPLGFVHGGTPENCEYMCIVFSASILHSSQKTKTIMKTHFNYPIVFSDTSLIKAIINDMTHKENGFELSVTGNLYLLMHNLLKAETSTKIRPNTEFDKIKPAMSYIEENYYNDITLNDLAAMCLMSPNYFCRYFKNITSETPVGYIRRYRIEKACEFLLSGMSITDTAYACGFNDTSYFINVFKKHIGVTPQKYKNQKSER